MKLDNDLQPEWKDQQQMPYLCFSLQQDGKIHFQWHSVGQLGEKVRKGDDHLQKKKLVHILRKLHKIDVIGSSQSSAFSK